MDEVKSHAEGIQREVWLTHIRGRMPQSAFSAQHAVERMLRSQLCGTHAVECTACSADLATHVLDRIQRNALERMYRGTHIVQRIQWVAHRGIRLGASSEHRRNVDGA